MNLTEIGGSGQGLVADSCVGGSGFGFNEIYEDLLIS
jgi:hypothetical protein